MKFTHFIVFRSFLYAFYRAVMRFISSPEPKPFRISTSSKSCSRNVWVLGLVWNAIVYFVTFDFRFYCCFLCCLLLLLVFSFSFEQLDFNYLVYFSFPCGINCFLFSLDNIMLSAIPSNKKKTKLFSFFGYV